nr:putative ribonuclease H-like domain-containing protein [Tanacetum cinerariifolium]
MTKDDVGNEIEVPPVAAQQILARTKERKAKSTLLMAVPDEHLARFHGIKDSKSLWAAIKTRFGDFKGFLAYLKFMEHVFLLKMQIKKFIDLYLQPGPILSLIMGNKPGIDNLDIDDLYNNLKFYEADIKGSFGSSSNLRNVAFVYAESTNSTNELNAAYIVSTATCHSSQAQGSSSYVDELMFLFFVNQSSTPQLDKEDLEQIDQDDLKEIDLKWQVAMLFMRVKRFYKKTGRKLEFNGKEPVGFDKTKVECFNCHRRGHFAMGCRSARNSGNKSRDLGNTGYIGRDNGKRPTKEEDEKALVVQDGLGTYDWSYQVEEEATDFALMAFTSNPSSSSNSNSELDEALKEKEDLKAKLEKFKTSLKNLTKLLDSQISVKVKTSLGYGSQFNEKEVLDIKEEEVTETVLDNRSSDKENSVANDGFKKGGGYHAVPPPLTGNYMPSKPDMSLAGLDDSIYKFNISETVTSLAKDEKDTPETSIACVEKPNEDRMSKKFVLPTNVGKRTGHGESRPVWNNVQRINHQNKFAPIAVFIRFGRIPVSTTKPKAAASTSAAKPVNTAGPKQSVNFSRTRISAVKGNEVTAVKTLAEIHDGGFVAFGSSRGKITGKGKIRIEKLNFDDVYFINELKFNLFSVSQMCDKKNSVLFTETECLVLSSNFKLRDKSQVLLRVPRQSNMYSFDLQNVVPSGDLTCLFAKASIDESNLWHRRLGRVNFKTMNKLVKGNLVRGLPSKIFNNDHSCVACQKEKQHKATCKAKLVSSISQPLQMLHMDLFGPTSIMSINHKKYCLVVIDDFSRFTWVFFLATKDETSKVLKPFITAIENQINKNVKVIRCDNRTKLKNKDFDKLYGIKGIKREYSNAITLQQNGVIERKNMTLIDAARTMLVDSLLLVTFWAEAVNTACYVLNRALVTKTHNKTPYKLLNGRSPRLDLMRPFGCLVTILNTLDPLGKFKGKADEGFLVGYSVTSKAFRVFNAKTRKVEENLHVRFLENKSNITGT